MLSSKVPYTEPSKPCFAAHLRTSFSALRCALGMVLSRRAESCETWRSASSFVRASFSRSCISSRRLSAQPSSCSETWANSCPTLPLSSCSNRSASARLALAAFRLLCVPASHLRRSPWLSCSCWAALSRLAARRATSSLRALFLCWTLLYCVPRPCFARSCPRCASQTCFRCTSSLRLAISSVKAGLCCSNSTSTWRHSAWSRFASSCSSALALPASSERLLSSPNSSLARVSSSS
mmetsp:Transcript_7784/g.12373  ORF Transcript_7784/g.12373 Transcript_7784/m.12373 type:complete len:237 (-) Transcript_7784:981-1691(-)